MAGRASGLPGARWCGARRGLFGPSGTTGTWTRPVMGAVAQPDSAAVSPASISTDAVSTDSVSTMPASITIPQRPAAARFAAE